MAKFAIHQIKITDGEIALINSTGDFNAVPKKKVQLDMQFDFGGDKIGGLAYDAMEAGYYTHVANIEANDLNDVFNIGNIGPEQNIERLAAMHSLSVGDIIIDEEGQCNVVASSGFVAFSFRPQLAA